MKEEQVKPKKEDADEYEILPIYKCIATFHP